MKILAVPISRPGIFVSWHRPQWLSQQTALLCSGRSLEQTHVAFAKTFHKGEQNNSIASSSHSLLPSFSYATLQTTPACLLIPTPSLVPPFTVLSPHSDPCHFSILSSFIFFPRLLYFIQFALFLWKKMYFSLVSVIETTALIKLVIKELFLYTQKKFNLSRIWQIWAFSK